MKRKMTDIQKILVVTLSNLGDAVLTLPVVESLRAAYPDAAMDVLAGPGARDVFLGDARIGRFFMYEKKSPFLKKWQLLQTIRSRKYDLIIDLRRSLFGLLGGGRFRNSYTSFLPGNRSHRVLRHLYALKRIVPIHRTRSFLSDRQLPDFAELEALIVAAEAKGQPLVLVSCGSKSDIKKWPASYYADLLDRLVLDRNCRVMLVGDKNDIPNVGSVAAQMRSPVVDLCGRTSFEQLLFMMKRAALVITNDSAPLHIADALRRPVLALFGPTDPRKYGPRYRNSRVARRLVFCSPCEKAQCRYRHECMRELGVDEVYRAASGILTDKIERKNLKILVIRLDRIGDVTLSLPALQSIRDRFPNAALSVMARPATAPLIEGHPAIDEVIPYFYEKKGRHSGILGNIRFIYEIIRHKFDIVFVLNPSLRSYLVPWLAGIPYRVGFSARPSFLLTHSVADRRHEGKKHEAEYTLDVVRAFGIEAERADRYLGTLNHLQRTPPGEFIALHAGASCPSKRWPKERFAELGRKIRSEYPQYQLMIIGGEDEKEIGAYLSREIGQGTLDLTAKQSLQELAACLGQCCVLVSNDSGPVHIAAAVGTRTLTIFGRSLPGLGATRWRALGEGHAVIQKDVGCVECLAHRCSIEYECLKAVSVEEVWEKVKPMLRA